MEGVQIRRQVLTSWTVRSSRVFIMRYYFELFELGVAAVNPKEDMEWFPQVGSFLWIDDRRKEQFQKLSLTLKLCLRASHA